MMSKLVSDLYKITRKIGKTASVLNDVENLSKGKVDKVISKRIKSSLHSGLNKFLK